MKKYILYVIATAVVVIFSAGSSNARDAALVKQQYDTIKSKLDEGGDLMVVVNVDGMLEAGVEKIAAALELASPKDPSVAVIRRALKKLPGFLQTNGFYAVTGAGFSMVPAAGGQNTAKGFLARQSSAATTPLWRGLFGLQSVEMKTTAYLPTDTEFVRTFISEPAQWWKIIQEGSQTFGTQESQKAFEQYLTTLTAMVGAPLETLVNSIGNESFLSLQIAPAARVNIPTGEKGQTNSIPEPSLLAGITVNDDMLFSLLKTRLCGEGLPATATEKGDVKMITMNTRLPLPIPVQVTIASQSNVLLIGSNPKIIQRALEAAKTGTGLTGTEKFKKAFGALPMTNNGMIYFSSLFSKMVGDIQEKMMVAQNRQDAAINGAIIQLFQEPEPEHAAMVILNIKSGVLLTGQTSLNARYMMASFIAAPIMIMAGAALPAIIHARSAAQRPACINNLQQIHVAKEQWAMEAGAKPGTPVSPDDIAPYMRGGVLPACPEGGSYILNAVGEKPTCDRPGHQLK